MIDDGPVSFWGAKGVGNHQALITADHGPAIPSAQANRTAQLQAWSGATSRHGLGSVAMLSELAVDRCDSCLDR
jgi:hypothetical protein